MNNKEYDEQDLYNAKLSMIEELGYLQTIYQDKATKCSNEKNYTGVAIWQIKIEVIQECIDRLELKL